MYVRNCIIYGNERNYKFENEGDGYACLLTERGSDIIISL